tara:strand:- start:3 stop:689 length:687 start_codon:yes stop_codon:yes gene_type:complete
MNIFKENFQHLINNIEKTSSKNSIFNYKSGRKAFLSIEKGTVREWLETLLPNTRLIIEPKIIGSSIGIQYINGQLNKAINENSFDITEEINALSIIPERIPVRNRIEILGILYDYKITFNKNTKIQSIDLKKASKKRKGLHFCAFQIFNCKINHFQTLQELKKLDFEIPETQFTKYISDIEIYRLCWKEGRLFQNYPTSGIVLKINSRKLQKYLEENSLSRNWAYSIN